jgi:hypothetical protein
MIDHDNDGDNIDPTSNPLVNVTCVVVMIAASLFGFNWFVNRPIGQGQQATTVQAPIAAPEVQPPIATPSATPLAVTPPPVVATPAPSPAAVQTPVATQIQPPATTTNIVKSAPVVKTPADRGLTQFEREAIAAAVNAKHEAAMKPWEKMAAATD